VRVGVQLFATLVRYLPAGATGDGLATDVDPGTTVGDVIRSLGIPSDFELVSVVNGHDAPREHVLADGDVVSLFPPLAGGRQRRRRFPPRCPPRLTSTGSSG